MEHVAHYESIGNSAEGLRTDVPLGRYTLGYVVAVVAVVVRAIVDLGTIGLSLIF